MSEQNLDFNKIEDLMLVHGRHFELSEEQRLALLKNEEVYLSLKRMPSDPLHPAFYHVFDHTLPPEHHYRIIPNGKYLSLIFF